MQLNKEVSNRIAMLRTIMIAGVVFVHAAEYDRITGMGDGFLDYLMGFFNYAALRVPVPLLAMVSGYLLFAADLDLKPRTLWVKKARTVALPFLFFNFLAILLFFSLQQIYPGAIMHVDLLHAGRYDWINAMFGVRDAPFDYPLYFIRDLLVLIALAPLFGLFIRRAPFLGLAIVVVIFFFNYDEYLIIRSTSAIMFYVGGMFAVMKSDLLALDKYAAPMLLLFVGICLSVVLSHSEIINYAALTGPFLLWPAFKYLTGTKIGKMAAASSKYSFFIFIAHAPVLQLLRFGYDNHLQSTVPYFLYWVAAPVLAMAGLVATYKIAMRVAPVFFAFVTGGRDRRNVPAFVERRRAPRPDGAPVYSEGFRLGLAKS